MTPAGILRAWSGLLALVLGLGVAVGAEPLTGDSPLGGIDAHLAALERLIAELDSLEALLGERAREALDRADAAQGHDERSREERLAAEIGERINALRATRADLARPLQLLKQRVGDGVAPRPEP